MSDKKAFFVRVLAVGKGYYNTETNETIPLDTKVGAVLLVAPEAITFFSQFGALDDYADETIGVMREGAAIIRFSSDAAYKECFRALNQTAGQEKTP